MELLTNRINKVTLEGEADWSATASWSFNDVEKGALSVSPVADGLFTATLPYIMEEGTAAIHWSLSIPGSGTFERTDKYSVVTPILTLREVSKIFEEGTPEEQSEVESAVRHIIQAHTGQTFGKYTGTKIIVGSGGHALPLPARLLSVNTLNGFPLPYQYNITGDGWYLSHGPLGYPDIKADYHGIHQSNGVIYNPYGVKFNAFTRNVRFAIDGTWGWETVPDAVREAAKLLVNDYAGGDSQYRDRYLTSMTAADWRIQFHSGAFAKTGNVRADQLLSEYTLKRGWAVI